VVAVRKAGREDTSSEVEVEAVRHKTDRAGTGAEDHRKIGREDTEAVPAEGTSGRADIPAAAAAIPVEEAAVAAAGMVGAAVAVVVAAANRAEADLGRTPKLPQIRKRQ
jgi:hypothetical protein